MGTGNLLARFIGHARELIGIDPSEEMLAICRSKYPGLTVRYGSFTEIPLPDGSIDLIISAYAFHHLTAEEKRTAVLEMKRVLRPGGRIALADVMFRNEKESRQVRNYLIETGRRELVDQLNHEYMGMLDELIPLFEDAGLSAGGEQLTESVWFVRAAC